MAEVMRHLLRHPQVEIDVRTAASASLFPVESRLRVERAAIDAPVHESADALRIDGPATAAAWERSLTENGKVVSTEARIVRELQAQLIVADIPYLAGDIAACAGVPCIGISNFLWNWILEPHLSPAAARAVMAGYGAMQSYWRLPFAHSEGLDGLHKVIETPLIAPKPHKTRAAVRERLGLPRNRHTVLLTFRGSISPEVLDRAQRMASNYHFLDLLSTMRQFPDLSFADIAEASDIVMGKLGYGLVAGCVANQWPLLYIAREGFREDAITSREAPRYTPMHEMPRADFEGGRWNRHCDVLLQLPVPGATMEFSGAATCAERIIRFLA